MPAIRTPAPEAASAAVLSIGALARASGIPVPTLRTWERRYGFPVPQRKPSGHRLYPASAVEHLRKVARLLERGHRAGEVLAASPRELDAMLALAAPPDADAGPADAPAHAHGAPTLDEMLAALATFDRDALMTAFRAGWSRLGPTGFLREIAAPLLTAMGERWQHGSLEIRHEHFGSACLGTFLREVREPFDRRARGRRVVLTTLHGDPHEGGLLMAALVLAHRGRRVVDLGTGLPVPQIAAAAAARGVEAVALSISATVPRARAARAVKALRAAMPRHVALWVGGTGAPPATRGVERFDDLAAFDARLG